MNDRPTPEEFDAWRKRLWDEIVGLRDARDQYLALFAHSPERLAIANFCAAWFFGLVQRSLLREIILGISRLTDAETMGSKANLVLRTLLRDPALDDRHEVVAALTRTIESAESIAQPIRAHRHKYIAHLDHAVAINDPSSPLPPLLRAEVDGAIEAIEAAYNVHGSEVRGSHALFSVGTTRGAEALIACLETSDRWRLHLKVKADEQT